LIEAGVDSLKVEGRMKGISYVGNVVRIYRKAIDEYLDSPYEYEYRNEWEEELKKVSHRNYTKGFFYEESPTDLQNLSCSSYIQTHDLVGVIKEILENNEIKVEVRNRIKVGDEVEIIGKSGDVNRILLEKMRNDDYEEIQVAQPNQLITLMVDFPTDIHDLIRKEKGHGK